MRRSDDEDGQGGGTGEGKKKSRYRYKFGEPKPKAQDNFTDPESRIMKRAGGGFDYCYNAQAAVDDTAHIIVAAELTNSGADSRQLPAVLAAVKANTGDDPHQVVADAGYRSEAVFKRSTAILPTSSLPSDAKANKRLALTRPSGRLLQRWQEDSNRPPRRTPIGGANGYPNRPTVGSSMYWASDNSACAASPRPRQSGNSSVPRSI